MLASSLLILCDLLQVYYTSISVCEMNSHDVSGVLAVSCEFPTLLYYILLHSINSFPEPNWLYICCTRALRMTQIVVHSCVDALNAVIVNNAHTIPLY